MPWSESWISSDDYLYNATSENKIDKSDVQNDKVDNTTAFLLNFEWNQQNIIKGCITDIQDDIQLSSWFNELLKSEGLDDFINKIKLELKEGIMWGLDAETLKFLVISIIAESIQQYKISSMSMDNSSNQIDKEVQTIFEGVQENLKVDVFESVQESLKADKENDERTEDLINMRKVIEERAKLVHKYENLDELTNVNSDKYRNVKFQLEQNWTLNQLKKEHDEQFINDYILAQATLQELKSNPTNYEEADISFFDKLVKNLNNSCNIPDTNLSSFSSENLTQTRIELFHPEIWNDSLIKVKNQNMESRDYSNVFPEMWDDDIISKYWKFLEWNLKEFWAKYQYNSEIKNKINELKNSPTISEEDRKLLQNYQIMLSEVKKIKEDADNRTKNMVEEFCIISQIKWMYMCMWKSADFELNKAKEIESENWILTLNGHIDWVEFAIRQDTNDPEARLQTSKKIAKSPDGNTFTIGWLNNFTDSNFILPSQQEIFETITETVTSGVSIENFDNADKYLKNLQLSIMWVMDKKYEKTKYVHHYMKNQVKWEKVVDSSLWLLKKIKPDIYVDLDRPINVVSNEKLFNFIKMLNFNSENSTDNEKDKLNKCIAKILQITENYRNNNGIQTFDTFKYPPIIENYLKNQNWLSGWMENSRLSSVFDMLSYYNQNSKNTRANKEWTDWVPSKIFINDLYRDLFEFTGGQSVTWVKRQNESLEKSDKEEADELLKWIEDM